MSAQKTILFVDDDAAFLGSATELLAADGRFTVVGAARDGAEALKLAEEAIPDLVLMDISMPAVDGVEATRAIHGRLPELPVVMLTGRSGREDADAAAAAGAVGYLRKDELGAAHFADSLVALVELS